MAATGASTSSSWPRRVKPDPPAAFSALQTTSPSPQRGIKRGNTCPTILRPGAPTTSPINRILSGISFLIVAARETPIQLRRLSPSELDVAAFAPDDHFYLAAISH